jgi:hypothetical protein
VALDDDIERLTIDAALGVDLRPHDVLRISFLVLSRGDSDEAEIEHHTDSDGTADASLVLRAVRDPDSDDSGPAPA